MSNKETEHNTMSTTLNIPSPKAMREVREAIDRMAQHKEAEAIIRAMFSDWETTGKLVDIPIKCEGVKDMVCAQLGLAGWIEERDFYAGRTCDNDDNCVWVISSAF